MKIIIIILSAITLTSCATTGYQKGIENYRKVQITQSLPSGQCEILIKRDTGIVGSGLNAPIVLDGKKIANLGAGHFLQLFIVSGEHCIEVKQHLVYFPLFLLIPRSIKFTAEEDNKYIFRVYPLPFGVTISQVQE